MMALRVLRTLAIFLAFTVEVKVRAAADQWRREPINCVAFNKDCAWLAKNPKSQLQEGDIHVTAERGSILWWQEANRTTLTRGKALVSTVNPFRVETIFGSVEGQGDFIVTVGERAMITALRGEVKVYPRGRGPKEGLILPEGFRVDFGPILLSGNPDVEIPVVAPVRSTLEAWWNLFPGTKEAFLSVAAPFAKAAPDRAALAGSWHKELVDREVAAAAERERKAKIARAQEAAERAKIKALFRKMNYLSGELPD